MKKLYIFFLSLSLIPFAHGTDRVAQHKKSFGALYALAHANDLVIVPFNKAFVHVNKSLLCIHPLRDTNLVTIYKETDTEITKMYLPINKFCEAVQKKQKEVLKEQKKILKKQQKEREELQRKFDGQLFTAIKENASLEEIQKLLESGVNPNAQEKNTCLTPLHYILKDRYKKRYDIFNNRCKDKYASSYCGGYMSHHREQFINSYLYRSVDETIDKIKMLLAAGACLDKQDKRGNTALHYVAQYIDVPLCTVLVEHAKKIDWFFAMTKLLFLIQKQNKNQKKAWFPKPILMSIIKQISPIEFSNIEKNRYSSFDNILTIKSDGFVKDNPQNRNSFFFQPTRRSFALFSNGQSDVNKKTAYDIAYDHFMTINKKLEESRNNQIGLHSMHGESNKDIERKRKVKNLEILAELLIGPHVNNRSHKNGFLRHTQTRHPIMGKYHEPAVYFHK